MKPFWLSLLIIHYYKNAIFTNFAFTKKNHFHRIFTFYFSYKIVQESLVKIVFNPTEAMKVIGVPLLELNPKQLLAITLMYLTNKVCGMANLMRTIMSLQLITTKPWKVLIKSVLNVQFIVLMEILVNLTIHIMDTTSKLFSFE